MYSLLLNKQRVRNRKTIKETINKNISMCLEEEVWNSKKKRIFFEKEEERKEWKMNKPGLHFYISRKIYNVQNISTSFKENANSIEISE